MVICERKNDQHSPENTFEVKQDEKWNVIYNLNENNNFLT